jgi:hypothetical protein
MGVVINMKTTVNLAELKYQYYFDNTLSFASNDLGIDFKKSGKFYVAICPVHSGKKPSLYLHYARQTIRFTCFTNKCNGSWDTFALIQEIEGCDFISAVKRFGCSFSCLPFGPVNLIN